MFLRGFDAEILMSTRQFLSTTVEKEKVVHQFDEAAFLAELEQVFIQLEASVILFVFLPGEKVFCLGAYCPVFQSFSIVARENKLDCGKEPFIEFFGLIG